MSSTLLRLGLWILVVDISLYVIHESFEESPVAEYVPLTLIQHALLIGAALLIIGLVLRMFEKGAKAVVKNRCAICRTPIPKGAIYCREHLRAMLHDDDLQRHKTRIR